MKSKTTGFSLAELLIVLAIVGIIATFTVPKVLTSSQNQQNKAVLKETASILSGVIQAGLQDASIYTANYFTDHINAVKTCQSATTEGCWDIASQGDITSADSLPAVVLANGAVITGLKVPTIGSTWGAGHIDLNGTKGPNQDGADQLILAWCYTNTGCNSASAVMGGSGPQNIPGSVGPYYWDTAGIALWESTFSH